MADIPQSSAEVEKSGESGKTIVNLESALQEKLEPPEAATGSKMDLSENGARKDALISCGLPTPKHPGNVEPKAPPKFAGEPPQKMSQPAVPLSKPSPPEPPPKQNLDQNEGSPKTPPEKNLPKFPQIQQLRTPTESEAELLENEMDAPETWTSSWGTPNAGSVTPEHLSTTQSRNEIQIPHPPWASGSDSSLEDINKKSPYFAKLEPYQQALKIAANNLAQAYKVLPTETENWKVKSGRGNWWNCFEWVLRKATVRYTVGSS